MSLKIDSIHNHGNASEEYIMLKAIEKVDIGNYAIVDRTFNKEGKVSNIHRHFFRLPSLIVEKGEYVSLRTSKGSYEKGKTKGDQPLHRIYWGSDAPIWNDDKVEQVELLKVSTVHKETINRPPKRKLVIKKD